MVEKYNTALKHYYFEHKLYFAASLLVNNIYYLFMDNEATENDQLNNKNKRNNVC